jgi:hypothetical protein
MTSRRTTVIAWFRAVAVAWSTDGSELVAASHFGGTLSVWDKIMDNS